MSAEPKDALGIRLPDFRLDGKVAIVTGGSKGLGRAMALGFAQSGASVVVSSRKAEACDAVVEEIRRLGGRAISYGCHVGDWQQCEGLIGRTVDEFGRIDVLVNNAGIAPVPPSLTGITEALFEKTFAVNLKGPIRLTALAAEHMPEGGSIINISSKASLRPSPSTVVYAAAKAGLNVFTQAASLELGSKGIRVNAIVCGPFHSDSFDRSIPTSEIEEALRSKLTLGRIAASEEIVGTALFLASEASAYMTGALLALDGGGT
jgi:NAD(P)-dependent dehydrogenase (short-subunit alcohol dehydrogenase family)